MEKSGSVFEKMDSMCASMDRSGIFSRFLPYGRGERAAARSFSRALRARLWKTIDEGKLKKAILQPNQQ
jgi:hypothetical protein